MPMWGLKGDLDQSGLMQNLAAELGAYFHERLEGDVHILPVI